MSAHDIETLADGTTVIHLYDNEAPFIPDEDSDTTGVTHRDREAGSEIVINPAKNHWEYPGGGWSATTAPSTSASSRTGRPTHPCPTSPRR